MRPSYGTIAQNASMARLPFSRHQLVGAWAPALGPSGAVLRDFSHYGNHGTLTGMDPATDWIPAEHRRMHGAMALHLDGANELIDCGSAAALGVHCTVATWAYMTGSGSYPGFLTRGSVFNQTSTDVRYACHMQTSSRQQRFTMNGTLADTSGIAASLNTWHFLAWVLDGDTISYYVDERRADKAWGGTAPTYDGTKPCRIGAWTATQGEVPGRIAIMLAYNTALPYAAIQQLARDSWDIVAPAVLGAGLVAVAAPVTGWGPALGQRRNRLVELGW